MLCLGLRLVLIIVCLIRTSVLSTCGYAMCFKLKFHRSFYCSDQKTLFATPICHLKHFCYSVHVR